MKRPRRLELPPTQTNLLFRDRKTAMQESVVQFGPNNGLIGFLTKPDESVRVADAPTAVILNAGIVHRIGPFRLHVDIARQLAAAGYSTLRIDLSGLGDSQPRTEKLRGENRAVLDVADAFDYLETNYDSDNFVLLGLCSGAFNAHQVCVRDSRVLGAVFIDGIVFPTRGYFWRHTVGRLFKPRFYRNAFKRRSNFKKQPWINEDAGEELAESEFFFADDLNRDAIAKDLKDLKNRNVSMLFLYTDGYDDVCGRKQFREMYAMDPDDQVQVEYYAKAEHTFRIVGNRNVASQRIVDWYRERYSTADCKAGNAEELEAAV